MIIERPLGHAPGQIRVTPFAVPERLRAHGEDAARPVGLAIEDHAARIRWVFAPGVDSLVGASCGRVVPLQLGRQAAPVPGAEGEGGIPGDAADGHALVGAGLVGPGPEVLIALEHGAELELALGQLRVPGCFPAAVVDERVLADAGGGLVAGVALVELAEAADGDLEFVEVEVGHGGVEIGVVEPVELAAAHRRGSTAVLLAVAAAGGLDLIAVGQRRLIGRHVGDAAGGEERCARRDGEAEDSEQATWLVGEHQNLPPTRAPAPPGTTQGSAVVLGCSASGFFAVARP